MRAQTHVEGTQAGEETTRNALYERVHELSKGSDVPAPQKDVHNRLYALLIGVDEYAAFRNLSGAVKDAENVKAFLLKQQPPVSVHRIKTLTNNDATAARIIGTLQELSRKDSDIHRGDPVLIYYAGHGSSLPKPTGWPSASPRIQCISPHDAREVEGIVEGVITDRAFGALLHHLADTKGNNITVILDCCHSGSGTRNDSLSAPRCIGFTDKNDPKIEYTVRASYQQDLWTDESARGIVLTKDFVNSGLRSHVVLSACSPDELAYEDYQTREGRFTSAFLRVLEVAGTDTMTYSELIRRLDILPSQTPQCEGRDKDKRIVFDGGLVQHDRTCYGIVKAEKSYALRAGQIHGVSEGDVFAIYPNREAYASASPPSGEVIVDSVHAVTSSLSPCGDWDLSILKPHDTAIRVRVGMHDAFRVHVDVTKYPELRVVAEALVREALNPTDPSGRGIALSPATTASISVFPGANDTVGFEILDKRVRGLGLERLNGTVMRDLPSLRAALHSASHFFHHLGSSPLPNQRGLNRAVSVRVWELGESVDYDALIPLPVYKPVQEVVDLKSAGAFYPRVPERGETEPVYTPYGVDVRNVSPWGGFDLFIWMFYFDCSTFGITQYYEPPIESGNNHPPLRVGMPEALPLNYGDAGSTPFMFELPSGQDIDVGFLRIFLSTSQADLSGIAQGPVVEPGLAKGPLPLTKRRAVPQVWDAITLAVVLKEERSAISLTP